MQRGHLNKLGPVLALAVLSGCVHTLPSPQIAAVPVPVSQAPTAPIPIAPVRPVWVPAWQRDAAMMGAPAVMRHRYVHSYYPIESRYWMPQCGSDFHPCRVEHAVVPIQ